jgi:CHAT domain-containing protein
VPFAALQAEDGSYLIDHHTILTAPSIQVLASTQTQQEQVQEANLQEKLIIGDPTMPPLNLIPGEDPIVLEELEGAEQEAIEIAQMLEYGAFARGCRHQICGASANAQRPHHPPGHPRHFG